MPDLPGPAATSSPAWGQRDVRLPGPFGQTVQSPSLEYILRGHLDQDLADMTWSGIYEGTSNWGHMEQIGIFAAVKRARPGGRHAYLDDTMKLTIAEPRVRAPSLGSGLPEAQLEKLRDHVQLPLAGQIKQAFDPELRPTTPSISRLMTRSSSPRPRRKEKWDAMREQAKEFV